MRIVLGVLLVAQPMLLLQAQATPPAQPAESASASTEEVQAGRDSVSTPGRAPRWKPFEARLRRSDGAPVPDATVLLRSVPTAREWRSTVADSTGRFRFDSVAFGAHDIRVVLPGRATGISRRIVIDANDVGDLVVPTSDEPRPFWVIVCLLSYIISIIVTRWHHIARPIDEMLQRQLGTLETRLVTEVSQDDPKVQALRARVQELLQEATLGAPRYSTPAERYRKVPATGAGWSLWEPLEGRPFKRRRLWEFLFWSRGRENAAWVAIHEIERQLAAFLSPDEYVDSYLRWAAAQLRMLDRPDATALAAMIAASFEGAPPENEADRASIARGRRALLGRALAVIYSDRDSGFSTLMEWHNKASWLMLAAAIFIGFLAMSAGGAVLFLAGAAGGFSSRLMRALRREDVPLDYGASWTTLFLSPLFGALAGWFGIAIVTFATGPEINLLGDAFRRVDWYDPRSPITLAIAFMMGFSERLFDAVTRAVELHAEGGGTEQRGQVPSPPRPNARPPAQPPDDQAGAEQTVDAPGKLQLPTAPTPLGHPLAGALVLDKAAEQAIEVNLITETPLYELRPAILTIPPGEVAGAFQVVALEGAKAGTVTITAHFLDTSVVGRVEVS